MGAVLEVRALRLMSGQLSHLSRAGHRDGFAARPHLPDASGGRGPAALGESFVTHIDRCLGCLNCQTACPSGVAYGHLLESTRSQIEDNYRRPWLQRRLRNISMGACCLPSANWRDRRSCCASISALDCRSSRAALGAEGAGRGEARSAFAENRLQSSHSTIWAKYFRPREAARPRRFPHRLRQQRSFCGTESRHHSRVD